MGKARSVVWVLLCLLAAQIHAADRRPLAPRITTILSSPDLSRAFWGIHVVSLNSGEVLYTQNADKLFVPASNTKLFTTAAVLSLIGPDYKFRTKIGRASCRERV